LRTRTKNLKRGQSTIEFCLVFFAFIFFLSMSYNAVVAFATYQYLSYANFMAARARQAGRETIGAQQAAAHAVMDMYVPGIREGGQNLYFGFSRTRKLAIITAWNVPSSGAPDKLNPFELEFDVWLITVPIGEDMRNRFGKLKLKTTAALGREPSSEECRGFFERFFSLYKNGPNNMHNSGDMEDNGC
jgi:hypothetical protein